MSTDTETTVREVVGEFVDKKWKFTAYNITTEVRQRGMDVRHGEVKGIVHGMFADGDMTGYSRRTIDVGRRIRPFLYEADSGNSTGSMNVSDLSGATDADLDDLDDSDVIPPMDFDDEDDEPAEAEDEPDPDSDPNSGPNPNY